MTLLVILGGLLAGAGIILMIWASVWMLIVVFQTSIAWGISLFIPVINCISGLVYVITHWEQARRPFLLHLGGFFVFMVGGGLFVTGGPSVFGPDPDTFAEASAEDGWGSGGADDWQSGDDDWQPGDADAASITSILTPTANQVATLPPLPTNTPDLQGPTPVPSAIPLSSDDPAAHIGELLEFHLTDDTSFKARLISIEEESFVLERSIGGGNMVYRIDRSRIRGFKTFY